MVQRIIVSLTYAVAAVASALTATGIPENAEAWVGLTVTFIIAFWGKFSSSTTIISANRAPWTEAQRKQEALDELNKGLK